MSAAKKTSKGTVGIVVGGGPAPGLNGVISSAAIEAINNGYEVIGFIDGFKWLCEGSTKHVRRLSIPDVSRIHIRGGSIIRTSRANPTKSDAHMKNVVKALRELNVDFLISIGGDDTAYTASRVDEITGDALHTAHVPKTIDNDLPLPGDIPTFGYQTARHVGVDIIKSLSEDAKTTGRWYVVIAMGRTAGHLALGIGKAAGATLTVIPEEFGRRQVTMRETCDILEGSIIKRLAAGYDHGVAILAEGLVTRMDEKELQAFGNLEHDEHGHIRLAEVNLGELTKNTVRTALSERGVNLTVVSKDLGYELRCADPIPYDLEYTRDLGYGAMKFLMGGGSSAMITLQGGSLKPIPFTKLLDAKTHKTKVRLVDTSAESYEVARKYMIRIGPSDLKDPKTLAKLARAGKMKPDAFRERFGYLR